MPIPPHTSFATAIDLGSDIAGAIATYDVHDAGTNYDVFYSFTAPANTRMIWAFAVASPFGSTYAPHVELYNSSQALVQQGADSLPMQAPVTAGGLYYLKIVKNDNSSPAVFVLQLDVHVQKPLTEPGIFVPDDTSGYPAAILSSESSGYVLNFVPGFPAGEQGDILHGLNVVILMQDAADDTAKLFSKDFVELAELTPPDDDFVIRTNRERQTFFLSARVGANIEVEEISSTGAVVGTHTLAGLGAGVLGAAATSGDGSTFYYALDATGAAIRRADLGTDTALSDLVAGETGYLISDILVLDDDTIVAMYSSTVDNGRVRAKRFSITGTLLNTYDFGDEDFHDFPGGTRPRLAYDQQPGVFWAWIHPDPSGSTDSAGISEFRKIRASDGFVLEVRQFREYETGVYLAEDPTATPSAQFGNSFSCPFFILPQQVFIDEAPACPCPPAHCACPPSTGGPGGGSPSDNPIPTSPGPVLPPELPIGPLDILSDPYWDFLCEGGGQVPFAAAPTDAESWVS